MSDKKSRRLRKAEAKAQAAEIRARAGDAVAQAAEAEYERLNEARQRDFANPSRPWECDDIRFMNSPTALPWAKAQERAKTMRCLAEKDKQAAADAAKALEAVRAAEAGGGGWWQRLFGRQ